MAKLAAVGTTISGALTALSGSATTGAALSAAGATTYAATKNLPSNEYEKTKHVPPGRVDKAANLRAHYQMEISKSETKAGQKKSKYNRFGSVDTEQDSSKKKKGDRKKYRREDALNNPQQAARKGMRMFSGTMTFRKNNAG